MPTPKVLPAKVLPANVLPVIRAAASVLPLDGTALDVSTLDVLPFARPDSPVEEHAQARREHFIPLRKADLVDLLCRQPGVSAADAAGLRQLCRLVEATFHFEFHQQLEELKNAYAAFDPDSDTQARYNSDPATDRERLGGLFDKLIWVLEKANFKALEPNQLQAALEAMSAWGVNLDVDFQVFERLEVYARGDGVGRRTRCGWRTWCRPQDVSLPVYQRLVLVFRLREHARLGTNADTRNVFLKIFKNIPHSDLETLLPGGRVCMTLTDRTKIFVPSVSGLVISVTKVINGVAALAAAGVYGLVGFLGLVGGTLGLGVRSYFGYLNTKQKYQLSLTESLYYQNLDNNAGVLFRLLDEAEEQECREAMLAWFFLWKYGDAQGWSTIRLDGEIENFLEREANCKVDFEVDDALEKLVRLGVVVRVSDNRWRARSLEESLVALDRSWDTMFEYHRAA